MYIHISIHVYVYIYIYNSYKKVYMATLSSLSKNYSMNVAAKC